MAGLAVFLVFVQIQSQIFIKHDLLCECLAMNTFYIETFRLSNNFLESHDLSWNNYLDICTDVEKAMRDKTAQNLVWIKAMALNYLTLFLIVFNTCRKTSHFPF